MSSTDTNPIPAVDLADSASPRHLLPFVFQDWKVNRDLKIRAVLVMFRLAQRAYNLSPPLRYLALPYLALYRFLVVWVLGIDLHWKTQIGPRLRIFHGVALVVSPYARLGADCSLGHSTTIGIKGVGMDSQSAPIIGSNVSVAPHAFVCGSIVVGSGAMIGAGSVVLEDVPADCVVAGNPARVLRHRGWDDRPLDS